MLWVRLVGSRSSNQPERLHSLLHHPILLVCRPALVGIPLSGFLVCRCTGVVPFVVVFVGGGVDCRCFDEGECEVEDLNFPLLMFVL